SVDGFLCLHLASQVEQLIFDHLRTAATPKKACEIACACSVTKQEVNKVLYKLCQEGKVEKQSDDNKWVIRVDAEVECHQKTTELKIGKYFEKPFKTMFATSDPTFCFPEEKIYQFLLENGPHSALAIAKHMGKKTRKEVNADLYALQKKHVLSQEEDTKFWSVYGQANKEAVPVIIQNNPTNIIYQGGVQNTISIADSRATQIGNYNSLNLVDKKDGNHLSAQVYGHYPDPFGDILSASPGSSLKIVNTPLPGEGRAPLQSVSIVKSEMENVMIGNNNQMSVHEQCGSAGLADEETNEEDDASGEDSECHVDTCTLLLHVNSA
uniref:Z-binding domain-containing protein n=1 Tax=Chelonoidis abingdonii TaxID=106734 RepID=A0A8C0IS48_CHEAB